MVVPHPQYFYCFIFRIDILVIFGFFPSIENSHFSVENGKLRSECQYLLDFCLDRNLLVFERNSYSVQFELRLGNGFDFLFVFWVSKGNNAALRSNYFVCVSFFPFLRSVPQIERIVLESKDWLVAVGQFIWEDFDHGLFLCR